MTSVHIQFISDFICPWCYLGKVRLAKIKEKLKGEIELEIEHLPYVLYPHIPKGGLPKAEFAKKTKPGMGKALRYEAEKEGIAFNYKYIERIPYSKEAHRLVWLVDDPEVKYELAAKIFYGYFEEGKNIEERKYLVGLAKSVGVKSNITDSFLTSDQGELEVDNHLKKLEEEFVSLVPTLVLANKISLPGLQEEEVWENYIRRTARLS